MYTKELDIHWPLNDPYSDHYKDIVAAAKQIVENGIETDKIMANTKAVFGYINTRMDNGGISQIEQDRICEVFFGHG